MIKKIALGLTLLFFLYLPAKDVHAAGEFKTTVSVNYTVQPSGITHITHHIRLENVLSEFYAPSYQLSFNNIQTNNVMAQENGRILKTSLTTTSDQTTINIVFDAAVVGKGKYHDFTLSFDNPVLTQHTGEIWEISIPRLHEQAAFDTYDVSLIVPQSFGNEAFMSPQPTTVNSADGATTYFFNKSQMERSGISAGFGAFQVFSFSLNYHLQNSGVTAKETTIDLPPDTSSQKMYYALINPNPQNVAIDADGNWLASYKLNPGERIDVKADGFVQIFASTRAFPQPSKDILNQNLKSSLYWQVTDPQIKALAQKYPNPQAIYDFVSTYLTYDYHKLEPTLNRLGALQAFENPTQAMCMEYTDLFIAMARSAGIPAHEIEGYAYTENKNIQPLALVDDVLHAWPEYWDKVKQVWVPVDPTWGSTTGGVDYFSKLDLRHFTFVIHGTDPLQPYPPGSYKLGDNPQKDVFVNLSQLPPERNSHTEISTQVDRIIPFLPMNLRVKITNAGPESLVKINPEILFDGVKKAEGYQEILPPFATLEIDTPIPFSFLGRNTPNQITVISGDKQITIPGYKTQVITYDLIAMSIIISSLVIYVLRHVLFTKQTTKVSG